MMTRRTSIALFMTALVIFGGCIDEIDLEGGDKGQGRMVIQGSLAKGCPSFVSIQVSRSLDYKSRELPPPVSGALVYLHDIDGNELQVPEIEAGHYMIEMIENSGFPLETGQEYMISVTTSDNDRYISTFEPLLEVPEPDSVSLGLVEREELDLNNIKHLKNYAQFFIHTPLLSEAQADRSLLRWTFEIVYQVTEVFVPGPGPGPQTCYVSANLGLDEVVIFNGAETNSHRLDQIMLVEDEANNRFGLGYLIRVKQQSLSRESYQYWNQVKQAVSLSGGLFEATPGVIVGNISNELDPGEEVLGYFYATEEVQISRFVKPSQVGYPNAYCASTQNAASDECFNCTLIPNSTKELPEGWEF